MHSNKSINLFEAVSARVLPKVPFNFNATVYKPSHFPLPDSAWTADTFWYTINFRGKIYGVKMTNLSEIDHPNLGLTIFSDSKISQDQLGKLIKEIRWRFDMDFDISSFYGNIQLDDVLSPVLERWRGMRISCQHSLYELVVITIVLQNATIRRSVQMTEGLLQTYGTLTNFDGKQLYAFCEPKQLLEATEEQIRLLRVGYRAKFLKKISATFAENEVDEIKLRTLPKNDAKNELLKLYGIGPASVDILLFESLHCYDAFDHVSPWEQKIYSKLLFNKDLVSEEKILDTAEKKWGKWKMLAAHYLFEDLFWKRKTQKILWLENLIKL